MDYSRVLAQAHVLYAINYHQILGTLAFSFKSWFRAVYLLGLLWAPSCVSAQINYFELRDTSTQDSIDLSPYLSFWVDSSGHANSEIAFNKPYINALDTAAYLWKPFKTFGDLAVWSRCLIKNSTGHPVKKILTNISLRPESGEIWMVEAQKDSSGGPIYGPVIQKISYNKSRVWSPQITFPANQMVELRIRVFFPIFTPQETIARKAYRLYSPAKWENFWSGILNDYSLILLFYSFSIGGLFLFNLFSIAQYIETKERYYLFYALYIFSIFLYGWYWLSITYFKDAYFLPMPLPMTRKIEVTIFYIGYILYFKVLVYFLYERSVKFIKFLKIGQTVTAILLLINILLFWAPDDSIWYLSYLGLRVLYEILNLIIFLWLFSFRTRLTTYLGIGTLCMSLGISISFLSGFEAFLLPQNQGIWSDNMTYFYQGALLEILFFTIAFTHKYKLLKEEQIRKEGQITKALIQSQEAEANANIRFLRSQMNPHFIYNCLTALSTLILRSDSKLAFRFNDDFARLLRRILENSRKRLITLKAELEVVDLYIQLQQVRFAGKFRFEKDIHPDVAIDEILIPPTIIQPFLENALEHGLAPKFNMAECLLSLRVYLIDQKLAISIRDNGIGREAASKNQVFPDRQKESIGSSVTQQRINSAFGSADPENEVIIEDLVDAEGKPAGTHILILLTLLED